MMKLIAVVAVVLGVSQTQAFPTDAGVGIEFSDNVSPEKGTIGEDFDFSQQNEAQNLEEALFMYTRLLKDQEKSGIQSFQEDLKNEADEQTTPLCSEPACDCAEIKTDNFQGTRRDTGQPCVAYRVPYCQGVCSATHRYNAVIDGPGAEPVSNEAYKCCLSTSTTIETIFVVCKKSNGDYESFSQPYRVPSGCACSSSSPCNRR